MRDVATVLYEFWSSFGKPAYVEGYIPDDQTEIDYITYSLVQPDWKGQGTHYARVWKRTTTYTEITQTIKAISEAIGDGVRLPCDNGFIAIYKDAQFAQFQQNDDTAVKIAYLSLIIEVNIG